MRQSSLANSSSSNPPEAACPTSSMGPQKVKMVILGDPQIGKTSLVTSYTALRAFPKQQLNLSNSNKQGSAKLKAPFADYNITVNVDDKDFELSLWDTNASAEYEHIRPLNFAKTDIFLVCFSVTQETSLENVASKWNQEIIGNCPAGALKILVGLQTDMREEQWAAYDKGKRITKEQALQTARNIGAVDYVECSARTGDGVEDVFQTALNAAIYPALRDNKRLAGEKINLRGSGGANIEEDGHYNKDVLDAQSNVPNNGGNHHKKKRCIIS